MTQKFTSDIVIGLEIHVELNTKTKLFSSEPRTGYTEPNTHTSPQSLGLPGAKPLVNKKAIEYGIKLALATKSRIAKNMIFSRKSYFYPDLASNYQTTQYEEPLCQNGFITLSTGKKIGLTRIHLEEDPASLTHPSGMHNSSYVLIDYNRSGDPLAEIVTEPDMTSPDEARDFLKQLITLLGYLEIFDVDTCLIKADANVSIKESNYTRAEIKNITGFKEIERAITYEVNRQKEAVKNKELLKQETRSWDPIAGTTRLLRSKETEDDYGYIIEPNIPIIPLTQEWITEIEKTLPELAEDKLKKLQEAGVEETTAQVLSKDKNMAEMYESVAEQVGPDLAAKWVRRELQKVLNYQKKTLKESGITKDHMIDLLTLIKENKITARVGQKIIEKLSEKPFDVSKYVKDNNLEAVQDNKEVEAICKKIIESNKNAVDEYKDGKEKSFHFLVGQVMRETKGKAAPDVVQETLKKLLQ